MNKIYKYVPPERIDILENLLIRITQPKYLNDPFDAVLSFKKVVEKELFLKHFNSENLFEKIVTNFDDSLSEFNKQNNLDISLEKLLEVQGKDFDQFKKLFLYEMENVTTLFTTENMATKKLLNDEINKFLGVISFTESPDNIPMWAYYANVHTGFVIVFNAEHKFFNNGLLVDKDFGKLQKIIYSPDKTILDSLKEFKSNPFFEKHIRWRNEEEWRMILPLTLSNTIKFPDIHLINIPPELIVGIIFGFRTNPELVDYVHKLKSQKEIWKHLQLYKAIPLFDEYKMDVISFENNLE